MAPKSEFREMLVTNTRSWVFEPNSPNSYATICPLNTSAKPKRFEVLDAVLSAAARTDLLREYAEAVFPHGSYQISRFSCPPVDVEGGGLSGPTLVLLAHNEHEHFGGYECRRVATAYDRSAGIIRLTVDRRVLEPWGGQDRRELPDLTTTFPGIQVRERDLGPGLIHLYPMDDPAP